MTTSTESKRRHGRNPYDGLAPVFREFATMRETDRCWAAARDRLITGHLPVARHIAQRFARRGQEPEDLTQVAIVGLIHAVDRFDPDRGVDFLSFAVPTIMGEVRRHFRDLGWALRVPRRLKELHLSISSANTALSQELGRAATPSEIAEYLGITAEDVYEGLLVGHSYRSASLDQMLTAETDSVSLGDTLGDVDPALDGVENHEALRPLLAKLPQRERTVLGLRFFENLTQTEIAARTGISQMHVSRLLAKSLAKLRRGLLGL